MRIVVLGDFHLDAEEMNLSKMAMEDAAAVSADLIVPLGDFGCKSHIGHVSGIEQSYELLTITGTRLRPILGNHDLQRESGDGIQPKGTMEACLTRLFRLESAYGVEEYGNFRLFYLCCEPQPEDSCFQLQECYISDRQFAWFESKLEERPGIPAIVFAHAPPLGSGLRTVPDVHVRATNAYLDQNHHSHRWKLLLASRSEVKMWFSAHYHLSHYYPDSHTVLYDTHFFMTGVHGSATRDGGRQSRVIDITENGISVSTLDHITRRLSGEPDWEYAGRLEHWPSAGKSDSIQPPQNAQPYCLKLAEVHVGEAGQASDQIMLIHENLCYVSTFDGFLWEALPLDRSVMGTLQVGAQASGIAHAGDQLYWSRDEHITAVSLTDPWRFARLKSSNPEKAPKWTMPNACTALANGAEGEVWGACEGKLVKLTPESAPAEYTLPPELGKPVKLAVANTGLWILSESGRLWKCGATGEEAEPVTGGWIDWDACCGHEAGIYATEDPLLLWRSEGFVSSVRISELFAGRSFTRHNTAYTAIAAHSDNDAAAALLIEEGVAEPRYFRERYQVVCLQGGGLLVRLQGDVYYFHSPASSPQLLCEEDGLAIAGAASGSRSNLFALYKYRQGSKDQPYLEIWKQ
jgi:3',5'-cyclic AMP phosphodiesterase CpdA